MALILLLLALADPPPKGMSAVPAAQIHGRTFTSPDGWFSIDAPGADWEWYEQTEINAGADIRNPPSTGVTWIARSPGWKDWFVIAESQQTATALDASYVAALDRKFRNLYERDGKTMSKLLAEQINLPLEGSLRFKFITMKDKKATYHYGYVTGRVHRVMLLTASSETTEPPRLKRALVSLRWLKAP